MNEDAPRPLLQHSLTLFWEVIEACLDIVGPTHVLEIGSEAGGTTQRLAAWGRQHGATVTTVDPYPAQATRELAAGDEVLRLLEARSPAALEGLEPSQVCIVDGDHNWWTVSGELEALLAQDPPPLVVLHDTGWPSGRRDQYYAPDAVPEEHRHEHDLQRGVRPGVPGLVDGGFRGRGDFAFAAREGGPRNGVRTAIEDAMAEHPELVLRELPCFFGLGLLFDRRAPWASRVDDLLRPLDGHPLLSRLEVNRLDLYLAVLDLQDVMERQRRMADHHIAALERRLQDAEAAALVKRVT